MRPISLVPLALMALACAKEPAPAGTVTSVAAPQQVTITAMDYGYQLPSAPIHAGLTTITLANSGKELHQIQFARLTEGKTVADFGEALKAGGPPPAWAISQGGPNGALPGGQSSATLVLEPGQYVLYCRIPSADGTAHVAKGMILGMEVLPDSAPVAALSSGDIQMALNDYSFTMSQPVTAGKHEFSVTNQAAQPHEVVVVRLAPGATMEPWGAWLTGGMKGPPPGAPFAGITDIPPGAVQNFTAEFTPGTYGLICFVPDAGDGKPHVLHGMSVTFTVS
jgi:hypothetical protein